jgi:hypothetical protein
LLVCGCGADLSYPELPTIPDAEANLLGIVRKRALSCPGELISVVGSPEYEFTRMSLSSMLVAIRTIGKYRMIADGSTSLNSRGGIVSAASRVFNDWPVNLLILVEELNALDLVRTKFVAGKQFGGAYRCLFRKNTLARPNDMGALGNFSGLCRGQFGGWLNEVLFNQ